jgi:hypothetical protein
MVITTHVNGGFAPAGGGGDTTQVETFFAVNNGETVFTIAATPVDPADVRMLVNGVAYSQATRFTVGGAGNQTVTWLDVEFQIAIADTIIIVYASA